MSFWNWIVTPRGGLPWLGLVMAFVGLLFASPGSAVSAWTVPVALVALVVNACLVLRNRPTADAFRFRRMRLQYLAERARRKRKG